MVGVRRGLVVSLLGLVVLLGAFTGTVGLAVSSIGVGMGCGLVVCAAVAHVTVRTGTRALGPPDVVTLGRTMLACAVAALTTDSFLRQPAVNTLVTLAVLALVLDAVDGRVARRTSSATPFGARFDGEADAFLILVLSVLVAGAVGPWVLVIGAARYLFGVAGLVLPWMREPLPFRYWRKVVAATQGVVLVVVAAGVLPGWLASTALVVAVVLLAESFGRDVWWLWAHRPAVTPRYADGAVLVRTEPL